MLTGLDIQKELTDLLQNGDCSICKQKIKDSLMCPNCQKCFCKECIIQWLSSKQTCPLCIKEITQSSLIQSKITDEIARVAALVEKGGLCETHNLFKDYYCKDCKNSFCGDCLLVEKHDKNHRIIRKPSEKLISKILNNVNSNQMLIEDYINKYNNMIKTIEQKIKEYKNEQQNVLNFLTELAQESSNKYNEIINSLIEKKKSIEKNVGCLSSKKHNIIQLTTSIKNYEIPSDIDTLTDKMKNEINNRRPGELLLNENKFNPIEYYFKGNTFVIKTKPHYSYTLKSNFANFKITFKYERGGLYYLSSRTEKKKSNPHRLLSEKPTVEIELLSSFTLGKKRKYSISVEKINNKTISKKFIHSFGECGKLKINVNDYITLKRSIHDYYFDDVLLEIEIVIKPESLLDYMDEIEDYKLQNEKKKYLNTSQSVGNFNLLLKTEPTSKNNLSLTEN